MVLGFSIGKKKRPAEPLIVRSPSLPSLSAQGIPWPEDLVDLGVLREARKSPAKNDKTAHANQTGAVPFHRPFRTSNVEEGGGIASIYSGRPATSTRGSFPGLNHSRSQQRRRVAPTFNVMVAGARGTGKTSMLKLFLDTSEISNTATPEQKTSIETFIGKSRKSTKALQTACVEVAESRFDRILLTLIDTPGLTFSEGQELNLERSVSSLVKYIDLQYDETMGEESKVVRQSKGDQHVHLRAKYSLPTRTRSQATISLTKPEDDASSGDEYSNSEDEESNSQDKLTMNPAEVRVIKRLAARVNVLPVIAKADSLIDSRLRAVKRTIKRELEGINVGFGVFAPMTAAKVERKVNGKPNGVGFASPPEEEEEEEEDDEERQPRTVIRIRRSTKTSERSRSRRRSRNYELSSAGEEEEPPLPEGAAELSNSTRSLRKGGFQSLLPFALVSPQPRHGHSKPHTNGVEMPSSPAADQIEPQTPISRRSSVPPSAFPGSFSGHLDYDAAKTYPKGKFVRKYKWGTLDVLDPNHCDFLAMRNAILTSHFRALKTNTREVLYEKYRTDKLLARRATRNITDVDRKRLLEDLGL